MSNANTNIIQINSYKDDSSGSAGQTGNSTQRKQSVVDSGDPPEMRILCFELTFYNKTTQFILSCAGVFALYLLYGYLQELIFTEEGFKSYGWFLTLIQFGYYICFGLIERNLDAKRGGVPAMQRKIPMNTYVVLAALTLGTMGLSNSSLAFLNYPTQVIFKCCKLIPVMIGSILIQGKHYGPLDFGAAFAMCVGLAWFTLADSQISPNFNVIGISMISGALLCDAAIGNVQEKAMRDYRAPSSEIVLYSYGLGFVYLSVIMMITGNFFNGFAFCLQHPRKSFCYSFFFSLSGYLGIHFVLALVKSSGAPVAATVTTARKAVTIAISFLFFSKPFTIQYLWSGLMVVLGIYLNIYSKKHKQTFSDLQHRIKHYFYQMRSSSSPSRKFLVEV